MRIGFAFAQFHNLTDKILDKFFVAVMILFNLCGIIGNSLLNKGQNSRTVCNLNKTFFLDDRLGVFAACEHIGKNFFGDFAVDCLFLNKVDQSRKIFRRNVGF